MNELFNKYGDFMGWFITKIIDACGGQVEEQQKKIIQMNLRLTFRILIQYCFSFAQLLSADFLYLDQSINVWYGFYSDEYYPRKDVGWDFQIILISWGLFDIYIIFIEGDYILNGDNDIPFRETWNKLVDIVQNLFLISSLIVQRVVNDNDTYWNLICIILFSGDTLLNFVQFIANKNKRFLRIKTKRTDINRVKGFRLTFFIFSYVGQYQAAIVILNMYLQFDPFYNKMFKVFYWCIIILAYFSFMGIFYIKEGFQYISCSFNGKNFVNFVYGLTFGIGSVYFAPVADLICIYLFLRGYLCKCPQYRLIQYIHNFFDDPLYIENKFFSKVIYMIYFNTPLRLTYRCGQSSCIYIILESFNYQKNQIRYFLFNIKYSQGIMLILFIQILNLYQNKQFVKYIINI